MTTLSQELPLAQSRLSQVELWLLNPEQVGALAPLLLDWVSPELGRGDLRSRDEAAWRLWAGRQAALRLVLASYTGLAPGALRLAKDGRGKPKLQGPYGPNFSVSACEGWWLAAFSDQEVGVDLECVRPGVDIGTLARHYFNESELACLQAANDDQERLRLFYRCWTRKEALLKMHGVGVAGLPALRDVESAASGWVEDLELQEGMATSLAMPRPPEWVRRRVWHAPLFSGHSSVPAVLGSSRNLDTYTNQAETDMPVDTEEPSKFYSMSELGPKENERLNKQALIWLPLELPTILETLPKAGRFVDLGCGTGLLAAAVAQSCPDAQIYGFDSDPLAVEQSRLTYGDRPGMQFDCRRLEQGPPPGFPPADVLVMRLVLMHLAKPERALAAARAWLKPGGILHILEADDRDVSVEPPLASLPELLDLMQEVQEHRGGSRRLGRGLSELLSSNGWSILGSKQFSLDPRATAAAVPKIFLPVAEFYVAEAERLALAQADFLQRLKGDLKRVRDGELTGAVIPLFHVWAHNTAEASA